MRILRIFRQSTTQVQIGNKFTFDALRVSTNDIYSPSRLLQLVMGFGTCCALAVATTVLVTLLVFKKPTDDSNNVNQGVASSTSNGSLNTTTSIVSNNTTINTTVGTTVVSSTISTTVLSTTVLTTIPTTTAFNSCLLAWNSTLKTVAGYSNGTSSSTAVGLDHPRGIFIDQYDNLYIADNYNNRVQKWIANATVGTTVAGDPNGTAGWTSGKMYYPTYIYVDSIQNMYIIDNGNSRILKWPQNATIGIIIAGTTGVNINSSSSFGQAWTMTVDVTNSLVYIADLWYPRIMVWPFFANDSSSIIPMADVVGVTMDSAGNLYATSQNLNTVTRFPAGSNIGTVVISSGLSNPWGLRFDKYDNLYVANAASGTIVMFCVGFASNSTGSTVASGLNQPIDVAFDSQMNMYVCEYGNHRIVKLSKLP